MSTERDELAAIFKGHPVSFGAYPKRLMTGHAQEIAEKILAAGYRKPRQVTTVEELDALPMGTIIACVKANPYYPSVFLQAGSKRAPWLHLDPSDREDGESTMPSGEVLRWHGNGTATVLHEGGAE